MTRIDKCFGKLRSDGKKGFIAYITAGDPTIKDTVEIALQLQDAGVDILEIGIPFSDPLADGRVNQESATRALLSGTTPAAVFDMVSGLRKKTDIPIMCYTYLNPFHAGGFDKMIKRAAIAGVDGLLFLDMPPEESQDVSHLLHKHNINNICLVTPTTPTARIKRIARQASGFIYCVSRTGVTGVQDRLGEGAEALARTTKRLSGLPVALGFGVSSPAMAAQSARAADAVVVGSSIVNKYHEAGASARGRKAATAWVADLVRAVKDVT